MLLLDKAGRDAAHDVCENHYLLIIEVTVLKPLTVLDRFGVKITRQQPFNISI
jgi:hypothetical protein